jgi:hypothetical protein
LEIQTLFLQGRFFFDPGTSQNAGPLSIPPFSFDSSLNLYFCPDEPTGTQYSGQLVISSNNPGSPNSFALSGFEETPPEIGTAPYGDGDTWTFPDQAAGGCGPAQNLTITNTGVSVLTLTGINTSDPQFNITASPAGQLDPGMSADVSIEFCPAAPAAVTGTLSIGHDGINEPNPIVIDLEGNGT